MEVTQSEVNENNNFAVDIFMKHHRKIQNENKHNASMDLQQDLLPALQNMYKINDHKQLMLLQPLLNMYIQNKYFGELLKKRQSVLIDDMCKIEQTNSTFLNTNSNQNLPTLVNFPLPPQDQPLDLSIKTKRHQNDMYHSFTDVLNLSNYQHNEVVTSLKSKPKRSRFKSPSQSSSAAPNNISIDNKNLNNLQVPSSSSNESDPDISNIMQVIIKEEDANFSCHICGQTFGIQDRLAKHVASCHKSRKKQSDTTKTYECEVCKRSFARSDMLTRHSRLHTGELTYLLLKFFLPAHWDDPFKTLSLRTTLSTLSSHVYFCM